MAAPPANRACLLRASMSAFDAFFAAQDLVDAGDVAGADRMFRHVEALTGEPPVCVWPPQATTKEPMAAILCSLALNGRAELRLDEAGALGFPLEPAGTAPATEAHQMLCEALAVHQCTYTHDLASAVWLAAGSIGHYLRASMEGFEHANKDFGAIMRQQVSVGGRGGKGDRHFMVQALELRRATTNARLLDGMVNAHSHVARSGVAEEARRRRIDTTEALAELRALRDEIKAMVELGECGACNEEDAMKCLQGLEKPQKA